MKLDAVRQRLEPLLPLLRCPLCGGDIALEGNCLRCGSGHCYDLSAKGYANLAPMHDQATEKYGGALFENRACVFAAGFYTPVLEAISTALQARPEPFSLLDVGCGEGYYARALARRFPAASVLGVDLSREAIMAAARGGERAGWLVADLKRLPVRDHAIDVLLDVLTPADYAEFRRVLAPGGELIKLVPGEDYLREVRQAVAGSLRAGDAYDNERVLTHLQHHAHVLQRISIHETREVTPQQAQWFLRMTPMTFSVPTELLEACRFSHITIHLELLRCRME
ncbi:MAG: methyltransferase domain-containing protein [Clostridia bacterium]